MRELLSVALVLAIAACGSSTEPGKAGDPAMLVTNNLDSSYVYVLWRDGEAVFGKDSVAPHTVRQCIRFLAQPDSAHWIVTAHDQGGTTTDSTVGYFNPADRPAWTVVASPRQGGGSPNIVEKDTTVAC